MTTPMFISRVVKPQATIANNLIVTETTGQVFLDYALATLRVSYGYHAFGKESITRIVINLNIYTYRLACRSLPSGAAPAPAHAFRSESLPKG
jgi:hypothetical protein